MSNRGPQATAQLDPTNRINGEAEPGASASIPDLIALFQGHQAAQKLVKEASHKHSTANASPAITRFSLQPLSALEQLTIKDLEGGVVHLGRYILLRIVSDSVKLKGLSAIAQDKKGTYCCLTIHNLMPEGPAEPGAAAAALPLEVILAVKVSCWDDKPHWSLQACPAQSDVSHLWFVPNLMSSFNDLVSPRSPMSLPWTHQSRSGARTSGEGVSGHCRACVPCSSAARNSHARSPASFDAPKAVVTAILAMHAYVRN
jgi:hypothetical protein